MATTLEEWLALVGKNYEASEIKDLRQRYQLQIRLTREGGNLSVAASA